MSGLTAGGMNTPDVVGEPEPVFWWRTNAEDDGDDVGPPVAVAADASPGCSPAAPVGVVAGGVLGGLIGLLDFNTSELASDTSGAAGHLSERISSPDSVCIKRTPSAAPLTTSPKNINTVLRNVNVVLYVLVRIGSIYSTLMQLIIRMDS